MTITTMVGRLWAVEKLKRLVCRYTREYENKDIRKHLIFVTARPSTINHRNPLLYKGLGRCPLPVFARLKTSFCGQKLCASWAKCGQNILSMKHESP